MVKFCNIRWIIDFFLDKFSITFSFIVCLITICIRVYSIDYIKKEKEKNIFFIILFFFSLSIQILIFSFSYSRILLGWDGLGVTSFYLVIFYHSFKSLYGSLVTVLSNRLGDCFMIISIRIIYNLNSWRVLFISDNNYWNSLFIFLASLTKRAQIPFSFWLPKAIAAPTPVSSLVHSSTLVTAGVYLVFRHYNLIIHNHMIIISILSFSTILLGGFIAIFSFDCKEIIAYSTLSQIGFMILTLSLKIKKIAFFHMTTHALFKSVLFMCAGFYIHIINSQDIRFIRIKEGRPTVNSVFRLSLLSISGLPFLRGFYSKDYILDSLSIKIINLKLIFCFFSIIILSIFYSLRLIKITYNIKIKNLIKWEWDIMVFSIILLSRGSIVYGCIYQWIAINEFSPNPSPYKILIFFTLILLTTLFYKNIYKINKSFIIFKIINFSLSKNINWYSLSMIIWDKGWLNVFSKIIILNSVVNFFLSLWPNLLWRLILLILLIFIFLINICLSMFDFQSKRPSIRIKINLTSKKRYIYFEIKHDLFIFKLKVVLKFLFFFKSTN